MKLKLVKKDGKFTINGKHITESEYEDLQKEVAKLDKIAQRLIEINKLPPTEQVKFTSEKNLLMLRKNNAEYWIHYILKDGKYKPIKYI